MATLKDLLVSGPARVIGNITGKSFIKEGGTSSQFLKADGSVDSNTYSTTSHNHSGTYKPVQTAVSDPTASTTASTTFIDSISQNANGVIAATKKTLPTASATVAGITKVGASGGAAAYVHTHDTSIATSTGANQITLAFGTKYAISAGGTSYVFTMPANPNTNTTYTIATGDAKGQIKVTPSSGDAYNVSVKGLGSAAYTESSAYATSGHTHTGYATSNHTHATSIATSTGTNQITLAFGTKYAISAGGTSYVFTMPANPNTNTTYTFATGDANGQIKVTPSGGSAQNVSVKGLGSAAYTESSAYATSGHNHSGVYKPVQTAVSSPSASSTSSAFIDTISQDKNGVITATKKNLPTASTTVVGVTTVGAAGGAAAYSHNHSDVYKPVQTAVSDPTASTSTSTTFIDTISQDKNGVITATKKTLPTASSTVAGITKVGASGGAAAYSHTHTGYATSNHTHATSIKASTEDSRITLAFGGKYTISAGGTSYVFTMPKNPNTDTTYRFDTGDANGQIKVTPLDTGDAYNVNVRGLGSAAYTESSAYATSGHNHSGVYKPVQTAVPDPPTASTSTATAFIDTISQNKNGVITATKKTLPTASSTVAGITTVGADGGAAAYEHTHTGYASTIHTHSISIATSTSTNQITLAFGGKYTISAGGSSYVFTMPANPDTNTKYTIATGDEKGQIKVIPSSGDAYNVSVKGLGSAAYTDSIDYATSGHTHGSITNAGAITSNTTIANGDHLVITDNSDSNKIKRASITFGTSQSTYLRNDGKWGTPSTSTPLPSSFFDSDTPGIVIPIATTTNDIVFRFKPITYNVTPTLVLPSASSTFALPIFMDKTGHLFMLISDSFASYLIDNFKYSTNPSGE